MANIPVSPTWSPDVTQIETTDAVLGGQDGVINVQAKQLADRTAYLKQEVETAGAVAGSAESKASQALAQIDAIEIASGSASQSAAAALAHKHEAQAAQALAEQARNDAQGAMTQAGYSAGYAYQQSEISQQKAAEAQVSATTAVNAASQAVAVRNEVSTLGDTKKAEIITASEIGLASVQDASAAGLSALTVSSTEKNAELVALRDDALAQMIPARDTAIAASQTASTKANDAASAAETAGAQAVTAATQAGIATTAKTAAEAARDAAIIQAGVYVDEPTGRAAVADGVAFKVQGSGNIAAYEYRRVNASSSTLVATYPSSAAYTSKFFESAPIGYAFGISDSAGKVAFGIKNDGTVAVKDIAATNSTVDVATAAKHATPKSEAKDQTNHVGYSWVIEDNNGKAAVGIRQDGAFEVADLIPKKLNGTPWQLSIGFQRHGGRYSHQINFVNNTGQSLAEGSSPATALTTSQEYDNVGFPARATSPTAFVQLTVANTQVSGRGESPMYGTLGHIKELIAEENGIGYANNDYQLLCCNNGYSGYRLDQLNKGTAPYAAAISQVQAGYQIATAAGKTFCHAANIWTQGEADDATSFETYRDSFIQLAKDYNADSRAITGQWNDVITIAKQNTNENRHVALAQLAASEMCPLIALACPMYQFDFFDYAHIDATNTKWLGGYYGLVYKRMVVDGKPWQPLKPIGHAVTGNVIDLYFNKEGLVLDTTLVPAQENSGFTVKNSSGVEIGITSVSVVKPNRVRIVCAGPVAAGWTVYYGLKPATGKGPYTGGCGNLRDSQGDSIVYASVSKPLYNWCILFDYSI